MSRYSDSELQNPKLLKSSRRIATREEFSFSRLMKLRTLLFSAEVQYFSSKKTHVKVFTNPLAQTLFSNIWSPNNSNFEFERVVSLKFVVESVIVLRLINSIGLAYHLYQIGSRSELYKERLLEAFWRRLPKIEIDNRVYQFGSSSLSLPLSGGSVCIFDGSTNLHMTE